MATRQWTRGTSTLRAANATVPAAGEIGVETDTGYIYVADGVTTWANLQRFERSSNKGVAGGYAGLDTSIRVQQVNMPTSPLPIISMTRSASQNVTTGGWIPLGMSSTDLSVGGFTGGTNGAQCNFTGWVDMQGAYTIGGSTAGTRRIIGLGLYSVSSPASFAPNYQPLASGAAMVLTMSETLAVNSGDILTVWAWQDSAVTLLATTRKITLKRVA